MKTCIKCNKVKTNFESGRNVCRDCRNHARNIKQKKTYSVTIESKLCSKCNIVKSSNQFNIDKYKLDGLHSYCNECRSNLNKNRYTKNTEKIKHKTKVYYELNKDNEEYKQKRRNYQKHKETIDIFFKLKRRLRNRLYYALKNKNWKKNTTFSKYIGCDREILIKHIESQFTENMTWDNYGEWHIDHVMPLDSSLDQSDLYKLSHYTNLSPIWSEDNYKKSNMFKYEIKPVTVEQTKPFILDIHYAHVIPSISYAYGLFRQDILVGVCTFGTPFSPGIRNILPNQILELNRLVLKDNLKNEASRLVSAALKLLPKNKIIISFADPSQGHIGTVYKACNFDYHGLTEKRNNMIIEGTNTHAFTNGEKIKDNPEIKYHYGQRVQKHRYITYVGSKGFKKFAKNIINNKYRA